MLGLKVEIEKKSGFCFGVRNAISKAEEMLDQGSELYCLGEIVHNDEEIRRLEAKGMKTLTYNEFENIRGRQVLFRAHGEPPSSYQTAHANGNVVTDASCPIILQLQEKISRSHGAGEKIYIFGKPNHPEIIALNGKTGNSAVVFEQVEDLNKSDLPEEITLYSQTTKSLKRFYEIIAQLRSLDVNVKVVDSICRQVASREGDLRGFCKRFKVIVFVSGKNSSNGKQLYEICRQENSSTHFISSISEIEPSWFMPADSVGLCGATSTPLWLIQKVKEYLLGL